MKIVLAILMLLCPVLGYCQKNELTLLADKYGTDKGAATTTTRSYTGRCLHRYGRRQPRFARLAY